MPVNSRTAFGPAETAASLRSPFLFMPSSMQRSNSSTPTLHNWLTREKSKTICGRSTFISGSTSCRNRCACSRVKCSGNCWTVTALPFVILKSSFSVPRPLYRRARYRHQRVKNGVQGVYPAQSVGKAELVLYDPVSESHHGLRNTLIRLPRWEQSCIFHLSGALQKPFQFYNRIAHELSYLFCRVAKQSCHIRVVPTALCHLRRQTTKHSEPFRRLGRSQQRRCQAVIAVEHSERPSVSDPNQQHCSGIDVLFQPISYVQYLRQEFFFPHSVTAS